MRKNVKGILITNPQVIALLYKRVKQIEKTAGKNKVNHIDIVNKYLVRRLTDSLNDNNNKYAEHRRELFNALWKLYPHYCIYCWVSLLRSTATIDHRIPLSQGGRPVSLDNLGLCCSDCNQQKGDLTEEEYRVARLFFPKLST